MGEKYDATRAILDKVCYKDWEFRLINHIPTNMMLYVSFKDCDGVSWNGRKWYISAYSTKSEIVQTAFLAIKTAEEHEMREQFLYDGAAIFGPHFDVNALVEIAPETDIRRDAQL